MMRGLFRKKSSAGASYEVRTLLLRFFMENLESNYEIA